MERRARLNVLGFDHVDVKVRDLPGARRFFEEGLGLEVVGEGDEHAFFLLGDQVLGLRRDPDSGIVAGVDHVALRVPSREGLEALVRGLGVPVLSTKEREDSYSVFVSGPEGLMLEIIHRPDPNRHGCKNSP